MCVRRLEHTRPGTVSLSLSENDDEPFMKQRAQYRNTEFLITTGESPFWGFVSCVPRSMTPTMQPMQFCATPIQQCTVSAASTCKIFFKDWAH